MNIIDKFFAQLSRILNNLVSKNYKLEHRYQNRNQITNAEFVLNTLKNKHFNPVNIIDIGCGHGEWTWYNSGLGTDLFFCLLFL